MDETLNWKSHLKMVKSKLSRALFVLNRVKRYFPADILKTLYFTLFQSHLIYGIISWGSANSTTPITTLQKKAIRIIHNEPYNSHTEPLFKSSKILKFDDLYKQHAAIFARDCKNNNLPTAFSHYFKFNTGSITRHENNIQRQRPRTKYTAILPYHHIPTIWNNLPDYLLCNDNRNSAKHMLKSFFLNEYSDNVRCTRPGCNSCNPN